jgi:hypothetical protein
MHFKRSVPGVVRARFCVLRKPWLRSFLFHSDRQSKFINRIGYGPIIPHPEYWSLTKFDVPHHPGIYSDRQKSIERDESRKFVNSARDYCRDMIAQVADISVEPGRATFEGWNIVIVRTKAGTWPMDIAKRRNALEIQSIPPESLTHLKEAALNKKKKALSNIIAKTGDEKNLLYLGLPEYMLKEASNYGEY